MQTVKLLSWHADVAARTAGLKRAGLKIDATPLARTSAVVGELAQLNPAALVLDLDKLPSNSREIALMLRASKSARHIPILFTGSLESTEGLPEKYARLRTELPDIPYAIWADARPALTKLLKEPRTAPYIVPPARVYTASLAQKLGVVAVTAKAATKPRVVALIAAPEEFVELLGDLPKTMTIASRITDGTHLAVCFVRTIGDLRLTLDMLLLRLPLSASAWIAYPKRSAHRNLDVNENDVRNVALASKFVDYKVCSIDAAWSALKFAHKKPR